MVAQLSNFSTDAPFCAGKGGALPHEGVLLRLTLGSELEYEGNLILPSLHSDLSPPLSKPGTVVGTFIDECQASQKLFGKFFGPDGHVLTAHALLGSMATPEDVAAMAEIVNSLAPTGHAPTVVAGMDTQIEFARGTTALIGDWVMSLRHHADGEKSLWFNTGQDAHLSGLLRSGAHHDQLSSKHAADVRGEWLGSINEDPPPKRRRSSVTSPAFP
jgi:hypothetical protein